MTQANQTPEQKARNKIDGLLQKAGWDVQDKEKVNFNAGLGIVLREYKTDIGIADYVLFLDKKPVGILEAKPDYWGHKITTVEEQSGSYAKSKLKWCCNNDPLPFIYESTGIITRFTDERDPKPRSREIFNFPRPETIKRWLAEKTSLRQRLHDIPKLDQTGLFNCQVIAVKNLEKSLKENRPRALIQMTTGAGKTFAAVTSTYRLLKYANANRVLFLVDTKSLGEQAEQEFLSYIPNDDNRKFAEIYTVERLQSSHVPKAAKVCISTIQRMYSILKGEKLDSSQEETNPAEMDMSNRKPKFVDYNDKVPPEFFDFIIIDECHRSIYNLWRSVVEYFDSFLIGLTATPGDHTYVFLSKT